MNLRDLKKFITYQIDDRLAECGIDSNQITQIKILDRRLPPDNDVVWKLKTDNLDFFNFSVESLNESKWNIEKLTYDYQDDEEFDALTEYTLNWRSKNVSIKRLEAHK